MSDQKVNGVNSISTSTKVSNKSVRKMPDEKTLKKVAEQLGISVEQLKTHLEKSKVPTNRQTLCGLIDNNKMKMKSFCLLNNIDYNKWRDYKAKPDEEFFVINNPEQYLETKISGKTPAKSSSKQQETKSQNLHVKPVTTKTPTAINRESYGSDYTPTELAKTIFAKSKEYYGAVGKPDFDALIEQINPKNASAVLTCYEMVAKETLLNTLSHEVRSNKDNRKAAMRHVYDALAKEKGTPDTIKKGFDEELEKQFDSWGLVNTKKLDETLNRMIATPSGHAQKMKNDIHDKWGAVGKKSFDELVNLITSQNASKIITSYETLGTGESLIEAITSEVRSSKSSRKEAVMHIYDMLAAEKNTPADKRQEFENELNAQFNSWGLVDTKKLDSMINSMIEVKASSSAKSVNKSTSSASNAKGSAQKVVLGNGKTFTADKLKSDAIASAKKASEYKSVKNPYIERPMPNVNSAGKIEAASEVHLPTNSNGPMKGKVVIVNAGHGGYGPANGYFDSGTVCTVKNASGKDMPIEEWRVAGDYTKDLTKKLQSKGATVVVVSGPVKNGGMAADKYLENMLAGKRGSKDVQNLFKSTAKSNIAFVSIHVESVKDQPSKKLCTARVVNNDSGDKALAEKIQQHVGKNIYCLRPEVATNDYYVTKAMGTEIPAVLLELGNIANKDIAASLLSSGDRGKYTQAIADALEDTLLKK